MADGRKCDYCGKWIEDVTKGYTRNAMGIISANTPVYCSKKCLDDAHPKEKSGGGGHGCLYKVLCCPLKMFCDML
jgi:hypothetical protein